MSAEHDPSPRAAPSGPGHVFTGLTGVEVAQRVAAGQVNAADAATSRPLRQIIRANVFTLFNGMLGVALVLVLAAGSWRDALFGFVLVLNVLIGVGTEYRAKRTLDRLAILDAPTALVLRDGQESEVVVREVVLGDLVLLRTGDQVCVDGEVLHSHGLEVDESMLTGEADPVAKEAGCEVLSGSPVVAGSAAIRATAVGPDSYANAVTAQARQYSLATSELQRAITRILALLSWIIVPVAVALFWSQIRVHGGLAVAWADGSWREAVVSAVAGVVGMVPEGLVLLTSLNFALAAMVLARQKVLVQELPAVEILARVDVLCLDKTGTMTDGASELSHFIDLVDSDEAHLPALAAFAGDPEGNATAHAMASGLRGVPPAPILDQVPFSSGRKWSALLTRDGAHVLGAPEVILADRDDERALAALAAVAHDAGAGRRVLLLAHAPGGLPDAESSLPTDLEPVRLAVMSERIRPDAAQTLAYFRAQGVGLRVISGDNPDTVAAIATAVDLAGTGQPVTGLDARTLPEDSSELAQVLREHHVLGRVSPQQKLAIVTALQADGHTVAMTGDGVNDALALKQADLGIAMGSGARATKAVARLVLMDGRFVTLPGVVAQGRRVMANMERVANLFLAKTTYSLLLAVVTVLGAFAFSLPYPFLPRHLTLISALTIGIPAFLLALPPNDQRYHPGFLRRVLSRAIPWGVVVGLCALIAHSVVLWDHTPELARTAAAFTALAIGLCIVAVVSRPWNRWRVLLIAGLAAGGFAVSQVPVAREFFALEVPDVATLVMMGVVSALGCAGVVAVQRWAGRHAERADAA